MIYVDKSQLSQVEYLIGQSILGNHVLFDVEILREVFLEHTSMCPIEITPTKSKKNAKNTTPKKTKDDTVEEHIEKMILQPSIAEKRAYLEHLDRETYKRVVRTYFNIVENNLFEQMEAKH